MDEHRQCVDKWQKKFRTYGYITNQVYFRAYDGFQQAYLKILELLKDHELKLRHREAKPDQEWKWQTTLLEHDLPDLFRQLDYPIQTQRQIRNDTLVGKIAGLYYNTDQRILDVVRNPWHFGLVLYIVDRMDAYFKKWPVIINLYWACASAFLMHILLNARYVKRDNLQIRYGATLKYYTIPAITLILYCLYCWMIGVTVIDESIIPGTFEYFRSLLNDQPTTFTPPTMVPMQINNVDIEYANEYLAAARPIEAHNFTELVVYNATNDQIASSFSLKETVRAVLSLLAPPRTNPDQPQNNLDTLMRGFDQRLCPEKSVYEKHDPKDVATVVLQNLTLTNPTYVGDVLLKIFHNTAIIKMRLKECGLSDITWVVDEIEKLTSHGGVIAPGTFQSIVDRIEEAAIPKTQFLTFFMFLLAFLLFMQRKR